MPERDEHRATVARYWDAVAERYLELFCDEFQGKPFDRRILASFARELTAGARVCDAGCGPCGHVTRLLADAGLNAVGVDISPKCIELARKEQPSLRFEVMDMAGMNFPDGEFQGLVAYYSLHYQPKLSLRGVIREFSRVLCPQGLLLIVVKEGSSEGWIADPMGSGQQVFWCDFQPQELQSLVSANGFDITGSEVREPLPEEIAVRRIYLLARRAG
jgi:ubiquinone/menaquinone biosynthesis C-methylase UbiE